MADIVNWQIPWSDLSEPAAGYPVLDGVDHVTIFKTDPEHGIYQHHPQIAWHGGCCFTSWSNHASGEDGPGQRVLCSLSPDGRNWETPLECFPSIGPVKPSEEDGRVLTANGWVVRDDQVYAIAEVHDNCGFSDEHGTHYSPVRTPQCPTRGRKGLGRIARSVSPEAGFGPIFWLNEDPPEPLPGYPVFADARDRAFALLAQRINAFLARPENQPAWEFRNMTTRPVAADGHVQCEPTVYRRPDGVLVKLTRDKERSHRLYAFTSADEGRTWDGGEQTDIPDSPSKSTSGRLPGGAVYIIGNYLCAPPGAENPPHYQRDPLVVALSDDGVTFDRAAAIRHGCPEIRYPGPCKGRGFQYPSSAIAGDDLWVIYSVGKEDIAVSRVPLDVLP